MLVWTAADVQSDNRIIGLVIMTTMTSLQGKLSERLTDCVTVLQTNWVTQKGLIGWIFFSSSCLFLTVSHSSKKPRKSPGVGADVECVRNNSPWRVSMQAVMAVFMQIYPRAKCLSMLLRARVWFLCVCVEISVVSPCVSPSCPAVCDETPADRRRGGERWSWWWSLFFPSVCSQMTHVHLSITAEWLN